jgi:hypothetical protein
MPKGLEVSWYHTVTKVSPSEYLIDGIIIPEQECHGAETEMTFDGMYDAYFKTAERNPTDVNRLKAWGHLHPWGDDDQVSPSGPDEDQFRLHGDPEKLQTSAQPWYIRIIFNANIAARVDIMNFEQGWRWDDVPWYIAVPMEDGIEDEIDKVIKDSIKDKRIPIKISTPFIDRSIHERFEDERTEAEEYAEVDKYWMERWQ